MIGSISADREATMLVSVQGPSGVREIDIVIDTGFTGDLTLPRQVITALGLIYHSQVSATLANGDRVTLSKFEAQVAWHGRGRDVLVLETDGGALAGMSLLYGSRVVLDVLDGGVVSITAL